MTIPFPMPTFPSPTASMPVDSVAFIARGNDNQIIAGLNQVEAAIAALGHTLTFGTHLQSAGTSYNGSANVTIATDATSANTVSTIVARDTSGNFSANSVTLAGTLTLSSNGAILSGASGSKGLAITATTGEILDYSTTGQNGDMPAGGILVNSGLTTGHRALSIFANDGTAGITVGAYYFTNSAVETVWQYANAIGKAQGSTAFQFYPKGGEVSFGQNYAASGNTKAFIRMYGTTTSNAGGSATLIVQQGGITTDTLAASALLSANGGLTVASGQTLTLTGVTVVGLSFTPITGTLTYAQLPTGNGTWDTGAGTLITIARSITVSGTTSTVGFTVSNTASFLNASPFSMSGGGGNVVTVAITLPTAGATVTIPDFAGVNDTFAFVTLAQTLANKTLSAPMVTNPVTINGLAYTFPASQSAGTALTTNGSGTLSWASYPSLITTNTTIIVAPSGGNFTTLQAALTSLATSAIAEGVKVTIQINDGTYTSASPILYDHVFSKNIQIVGQNTYAVNVTSIQSTSGSAGAWSLILNVSTVTNVATNDYIVLSATSGGTLPNYLAGVFKITNVDAVNTRITIASTHQNATAPSGAVTATGVVLKSILKFTGSDGFRVWNGASALTIDNLAIVGDGTAFTGLSLQDVDRVTVATVLGVAGFGGNNIFVNYNAELNSSGILASSGAGGDGFFVDSGGVVDCITAIASGNLASGVGVQGGYWRAQTASISTGNAQDGFLATQGGVIAVTNPVAQGNTLWGFLTSTQAVVARTGATGGTNGSGDFSDGLVVGGNGTITASGAINGQTVSSAASFTGTLGVSGLLTASSGVAVTGNVTVTQLIEPANNRTAAAGLTSSAIYGTASTGAAYPFLTAGNLCLEPRTSGANRDVVVIGTSNLTWATDNVGSIGLAGANRPSNLFVAGALNTGAPSGGTAAAWKLGTLVTAAVTPDTTRYIQLDVGGTLYKLIIST